MTDETVNNADSPADVNDNGGGHDPAAPLPDPAVRVLLNVVKQAFPEIESPRLHKVYLFPEIESRESRWGFVVVSRLMENARIELAAYSYEIPPVLQAADNSAQAANRKLESRRASIPAERLNEVIEKIVSRMDEIDNVYRDIDLSQIPADADQLEYLSARLSGNEDVREESDGGHSDNQW